MLSTPTMTHSWPQRQLQRPLYVISVSLIVSTACLEFFASLPRFFSFAKWRGVAPPRDPTLGAGSGPLLRCHVTPRSGLRGAVPSACFHEWMFRCMSKVDQAQTKQNTLLV